MNKKWAVGLNVISRAWKYVIGRRPKQDFFNDELPLRAELYSSIQMERHGKILAAFHQLGTARPHERLLTRLSENKKLLLDVHEVIAKDIKNDRRMTPAREWLFDNFNVIEENIRIAVKHLPEGYIRELPYLTNGPSMGLPRVYDIALETISHGDGRVDLESLSRFLTAYQTESVLKIGELWAIPIMLRLALIENLRRVAARIAEARINQNLAEYWADLLTTVAVKEPKNLILTIADMARSNPPMDSSFIAEITRRLHGQGPALALPLTWIENRLSESGHTFEQLIHAENKQQASDQISISNSIGSLRNLGVLDWHEFVENLSLVDNILGGDPADVYRKMDFATRDRYRHVIERIAKRSPHTECEVAQQALDLAQAEILRDDADPRTQHVGYYLIDKGLPQLERAVKMRGSFIEIPRKIARRFPLALYGGSILSMTLIFSLIPLLRAYNDGYRCGALAVVGILSVLCASHLAVALGNWLTTLLASSDPLPRMDFSKGIPPDCRTLVVVPTMLTSAKGIDLLIEGIEIRFLANRDQHLHFGLLTDFLDADDMTCPEDELLLNRVQQGIKELNARYPGTDGDFFYLFHRPRQWNPQDQRWMGYERKRGKLAALNGLIKNGTSDNFVRIVGDAVILSEMKYVITLDTDTKLARESAWQYVGTMAHPLNRPRYDGTTRRVVAGYGILQPQVENSLTGSNRSRYARMCASEPGIDPYTRTVFDIYQDMFGEGSFIGKGIYDIETFELTLSNRFPDNRILSHDLLEGCYVRSGLISDVPLYEEYPSRYIEDVNRRHRWIRGDWQIARWIFPRVPGPNATRQKNPLSLLSRWKIFDNLRRSLVSVALTLLLALAWIVSPAAWFGTLAAIGVILLPALIGSTQNLLQKPDDANLIRHLAATMHSVGWNLAQAAFTLACLPYEAYFSLDAIFRTQWRLWVAKKRLLQWTPSCHVEKNKYSSIVSSYRRMWIAPLFAVGIALLVVNVNPTSLTAAAPMLALWFLSPAIAGWLSRPRVRRVAKINADQIRFLRTCSRKTWAFFDTFVGPKDHWLPPDNYQERPVAEVAHRTSPTNIGLALLANLSAHDFGYISTTTLLDRTSKTLLSMENLQRYKGHFYNWYDTLTLEPLSPRYISSVDSGNLAGHLLTLRAGLLELIDRPVIGTPFIDGLIVVFDIFADAVSSVPDVVSLASFVKLRQEMDVAKSSRPADLAASWIFLKRLETTVVKLISDIDVLDAAPDSSFKFWANAFYKQFRDVMDEMSRLVPWVVNDSLRKASGESPDHEIPTLRALASPENDILPTFAQTATAADGTQSARTEEHRRTVLDPGNIAKIMIEDIRRLAQRCETFATMDYDFLYDKKRHQLSIGYNVVESRLDSSYYDLLASEARFACFVAIAQGKLPQESWFTLGRLLTIAGGEPILLSWSGSMFEYLMPELVMPSYDNTLLDQTCRAAVARQIEYGEICGTPWGISESGYNAIDVHQIYQYRAFGVPGIGLKRGLSSDLVIAPYASALALLVAPEAACANLMRLSAAGMQARYGFYEAIDYTPSRLPRGQTATPVFSFMSHHQGMSLLAFSHLLNARPMQRRFESDPLFQATLLLLQERVPRSTVFFAHTSGLPEHPLDSNAAETPIRIFDSPDTAIPQVQLLSNGRYHVMVTNAGGGYSRWRDIAVTRWREDGACDNSGSFCYIREAISGTYWSTAYQPTHKRCRKYEAVFTEGRAEFRCSNLNIDTHTEITVSPEDDIELRRVRITNRARTRRILDITSYAEVVMASSISDELHPAFSNLFVQTEIHRKYQAILCTRRPRSQSEKPPCMMHLMAVHGTEIMDVSFETDRMRFIGRGNTVANPQAMSADGAPGLRSLSGSDGSVLDPIVAIRCRISLEPGETAIVNIVTGVGKTRGAALRLVEKYQDRHIADRVFDLAWTHSQVLLKQINATETDTQLYGRLASSIIYANASFRAAPGILFKNSRGQSGLWGYSISGDLPIVLLQIEHPDNIDLVRQLVQAHAYWRLKGLIVDLVIWNEDHIGYLQLLNDKIMALISASVEDNMSDRPGGIFVRPAERIAEEDRVLIQSVARIIITDSRGTLADQIKGRTMSDSTVPPLVPALPHRLDAISGVPKQRSDLMFYNGIGGFTSDGREYLITTVHSRLTPAPWVNVLANPYFGTVVSESGQAYTWSENAHEFRLTPWGNDPVGDSNGEAVYLRDEESGYYWSPTPLPCRGVTPYVTRHGFGYSVFEHTENGIRSEMWVYVAMDAAVKFVALKVKNVSGQSRNLSATGYVEWVLGDLRSKSAMHVITQIDSDTGALFARNPYNTEFPERTAFFDVDESSRTVSGNRTEFLGRNGSLRVPAAMARAYLSGATGAAMDPCGAIQVKFKLNVNQEREIVFRLGVGRNTDDARNLVNRFRGSTAARSALEIVWEHWKHTLGAINVETPDPALNMLANGWLLYQTLSCRLWARSATYQSGGAFGFRDQLQDSMALIHSRPQLVRDHLLLCASRQYIEGDVQHWWHPPVGRGVRTHCSDDYLWLPFVTCRYVLSTGDFNVLDEPIRFLNGRPVNSNEESYYDLPGTSDETASLYDHCVRSILNGLSYGEHGLPKIGSGDWNDGMNLVGEHGKGESVWLGFFLYDVLVRFSEVARQHDDASFAERCVHEAATLRENIERHGWDGKWYRRAYFDDNTPLGSSESSECKIDSISQSWSVLSGAGDSNRSRTAMESVDQRLVRREYNLIQLLDPPFDTSELNPGYIKGYVPGVRENGGQYTHAAIWAAMAFARLGDNRRAWEYFSMINPVHHAGSIEETEVYKVEPYVIAADVYASAPHTGRGGWTWYTGSAAWMYRLIIESLLGLHLEAGKLRFTPCLPPEWEFFKIHYRYRETVYHITLHQTKTDDGGVRVRLDGVDQPDNYLLLVDDHKDHIGEVFISTTTVSRQQ